MTVNQSKDPGRLGTGARIVVVVAGLVSALLGAAVILGWHAHLTELVQVRPQFPPMQYNTALGFLLCGVGLMAAATARKRLVIGCSVSAAALAWLTLVQYLGGWDLGIDTLLFHPFIFTQTSHPGRMSPISALCFILVGLALIGSQMLDRTRGRSLTLALLASVVGSLSSMALLGYLLDLHGTFAWGQMSGMAVHTAGMFLALGGGLLALALGQARRHSWLPVPIALWLLASTLILWQALLERDRSQLATATQAAATALGERIVMQMNGSTRALGRMADRMEAAERPTHAAWLADAKNHVEDIPGLTAVEWIDADLCVRWIYPLAGNEGLIGRNLNRDASRRNALAEAQRRHEAVMSPALDLFQGGKGVLVFSPVVREGRPDGFIVGVFRMAETMAAVAPRDVAPGYGMLLTQEEQTLFERTAGSGPIDVRLAVEQALQFPGSQWRLRLWPEPVLMASRHSPLAGVILAAGLLVGLLVPLTVFLAQRARRDAERMEHVGNDLVSEMEARQLVESTLRMGHSLQRAILDAANFSIISTDLGGTIVTFNRAAERLLGYRADEVVGKTTPAILHDPAEVAARARELSIALARGVDPGFEVFVAECLSGDASEHEWTYVRKDGSRFPVLLSVTAMFDADGTITGFLGIGIDLTERKAHLREIAEGRSTIHQFIEHAPAAVAMFDREMRYVAVTRRWRTDYGIEDENIVGRSHYEVFPEIPNAWREVHRRCLDGAVENSDADPFQRSDGSVQWLRWETRPWRQADGEIGGIMMLTVDITAAKQLEERHRANEERFTRAFDNAPIGMALVSPEGHWLRVNRSICRMLGYADTELLARDFQSVTHPADLNRDLALVGDLLSGSIPSYQLEKRYLHKDGQVVFALLDVSLVRDSSGQPLYFVSQIQDVTESRRIETELHALAERIGLAAQAANFGVWEWGIQSGSLAWDGKMREIYGFPPDTELGYRDWAGRVHPDDLVQTEAVLEKMASEKDRAEFGFRIILPDGEVRHVHAAASIVEDGSGQAVRMVGVNLDITSRKLAEAELGLARDSALESARLKSEFLANMSHEIRTPMNGVIGMTSLLLSDGLAPQQRAKVETIRNCGESLLTILNDILDFSKIEAGKLEFEAADFDLRQLIKETNDLLMPSAMEKRLACTAQVDPEVPEAVNGDSTRLRQVLTNLMGNAIKFTAEGTVALTVETISSGPMETMLLFRVTDTGVGIPGEAQARLFQVFSQADGSTTRKFGGTGLGLAICKRLVNRMGGEIGVESQPGKGSIFWFTARLGRAASGPASRPGREGLRGVRVLLAGSGTGTETLHGQLVAWGIRLETAPRSAEVPDRLDRAKDSRDPFSAVILATDAITAEAGSLCRTIEDTNRFSATRIIVLSEMAAAGLPLAGNPLVLAPSAGPSALYNALLESLATDGIVEPFSATLPGKSLSPPRILLAEDNAINQQVALGMLELMGCSATIANNGREALEQLQKAPYDVVLMDCQMPEMDGFEATRIIRQMERARNPLWPSPIRIVAMTANALVGDRDRCLAAGMDDYLAKPVRASELRAALELDGGSVETPKGLAAAPAGAPEDELVDWDRLSEVTQDDPLRLVQVLGLILDQTPKYLSALDAAVRAGAVEDIHGTAHKCAGSCAQVGLVRMVSPLREVEQRMDEGLLDGVEELVRNITTVFDETRPLLEDRLATLKKENIT